LFGLELLAAGNYDIGTTWRLLNKESTGDSSGAAFTNGSGTVFPLTGAALDAGLAGGYIYAWGDRNGANTNWWRKRYKVGTVVPGGVGVGSLTLVDETGAAATFGGVTGDYAYRIFRTLNAGVNRWSWTEYVDPRLFVLANGTDVVLKWDGAFSNLQRLAATAQVERLTPANVQIGDIFTAIIDGISISFTATAATVANVVIGLTVNIGAQSIVTAVNTGPDTSIVLTANDPGYSFTITTSTTDGGGVNDQTLTVAQITANVTGQSARFVETFANHLILAINHAFKWSGFGNPNDFSFDIASYSGGGQLVSDADDITGLASTGTQLFVFKEGHFYIFEANNGRPAIIKAGYFRGVGCSCPFSIVATQGNVFWVSRDGFYYSSGGAPERLGEGVISKTFSEDMSWSDKSKAFAFYSEISRELMFFYTPKTIVGSQPSKAMVLDLSSGAWSIWEIDVTAYTESKLSSTVTIDTIEVVYDWGPPETIDSMPFTTIDSIGGDTGYRVRLSGDKSGKVHRFGENYSDSGLTYDFVLISPLINFAEDISAQSLLTWGRLLTESVGRLTPVTIAFHSRHDINAPMIHRETHELLLDGFSVNFPLRTLGTWLQFTLSAPINENLFSIIGWSLEHVQVARRKLSPYATADGFSSVAAVQGGSSNPSSSINPPPFRPGLSL
jgi:hypothetical protein